MNKQIYDPKKTWFFYRASNALSDQLIDQVTKDVKIVEFDPHANDRKQQLMQMYACEESQIPELVAAYIPQIPINQDELFSKLEQIPFDKVKYVNKFKNEVYTTPRYTMAYGHRDEVSPDPYLVNYRGLNFMTERMPDFLQELAMTCRKISIEHFNFDPEYNSCIIGKYYGGEDKIAFHTDAETFLKHTFCANVTVCEAGGERDFQFREEYPCSRKMANMAPQEKEYWRQMKKHRITHEITLQSQSVFFFNALEHALPQRKRAPNKIRYSISFRNMENDIGIGNSYYYCRGLNHAIDDEAKSSYMQMFNDLLA